ncbi:MAG: hypothetical protein Q9162_005173 [Coniocarpon cinnabarinum]
MLTSCFRQGLVSGNNEVDFEETWGVIAEALREMHTKNASKLSFESIYRHAYKLVLKKKGDVFYNKIQSFESAWLSLEVLPRLQELVSASVFSATNTGGTTATVNERRAEGENFMRGLKGSFEDHQLVMNMSTDVFMYLPSIYTAAMIQYRDSILRHKASSDTSSMLETVIAVILDHVQMDRDGDPIDKQLIKSCVTMLESLHETAAADENERLYLTSFEPQFIASSRIFYQAESARLLQNADAASYCRHTLKRVRDEVQRCETTLSESTAAKITLVVDDEMIKNKLQDLIVVESGVRHMVENDKYGDLKLLYALNTRVDQKKTELTQALQRGVHEVGGQINDAAANASHHLAHAETEAGESKGKPTADRAINAQTAAAIQWVEAILKLKDKYDVLWRESLESDPIIQPALTRSFTESINIFSRSSEYISLFIDENMKKGLKDKTENEVDQILDKAITLLRYIQDKDMFERYYKKHLCKRLLMNKSLSIENEREMIRKMKIELGNSFVSKLEAMFKDMALSDELSSQYRNKVNATKTGKTTELSIHVLTSMTWPLESMQSMSIAESGESAVAKSKVIFSPQLERVKQGFENFYASKHSGRQLTWMPHMGTADVRATFPKIPGKEGALGKERRYELNVSTYAMLILMLFNDLPHGSSLTFNDIQARTNIGSSDLVRNLQSLAVAPKTRVLVKQPMSKDVKPDDRFSFNDAFSSPFLKLKVGVVAGGDKNRVENDRERRETERKADEHRGYQVEAAIVRIMKQRRELSHQNLTVETISQLSQSFRPDVAMVKKKIESLIDREYLERIEDSTPPSYRYIT